MKTKKLRKKITEIADENGDSIRKEVAKEALAYNKRGYAPFFRDLLSYGCISGVVSSLIYYRDTHAFFIKYYNEIEQLRDQYEQETGEPIKVKGDLMNFYAWFSFEAVAYKLAQDLGIIDTF